MRSQRWRLRAAVTSAAVVALVAATGPTTGSAAPPATPRNSTTTTSPASGTAGGESVLPTTDNPTAGGTGSTQVTLITGDVVSYSPGVDGGKPTVEVTSQRTASFTQLQDGEHYYVFPGDTRALVGAGKLDKMLFDVAYLAKNGYTDSDTKQLPVIVQYPKPAGSGRTTASTVPGTDAKALSTKADALPATSHATGLSAVNSAAVRVDKAKATTFWSSVDAAGPDRTSLDAGVARLWLDRKVTASLDVSVPQIGAPEAWAAGYDGTGVKVAVLDTGIDDTHPDFAGKIAESKSFIEGETTKDGFGHGTHVASTIVGSGAASDGKYKGVAPGAQLVVGKVLSNAGTGTESQTIAGMEWAAQSGAKIVSMSLGACCGDGTDPMAQAVNDLTARYGTLFVIAAGNNYVDESIGSPGTADAALTVAAVDKQDQMAAFSSRGPRQGDAGLKPDIAAPGVNIVAARAEGTTMPGAVHVGEKYTTVSGTSMATPHVAGSAAILAQEHPDWTGAKLKQVLISTSKDVGHGTYEQGAGRVDVARATTQPVYATGNVAFGLLRYPHSTPASKPLTYVNDGDSPVTLALTAALTARTGQVPDGMLTVSPSTVTVPAHGTASVDVVLDPTKGGANTVYGGAVHAVGTDGSVTVNTAVGARLQARQVNVTMTIIDRPEATDMVYYGYSLFRLDDDTPDELARNFTGPNRTETIAVDAGVYAVTNDVTWRDPDGEWNRALFTNPNVDATGTEDVTVTFDLRRAVPEVARTSKPSVPYSKIYGASYVTDAGRRGFWEYRLPYGADKMWSLPSTERATHGTFTGYSTFYNGIDPVTMSIAGRGGVTLHPQYQAVNNSRAPFTNKVTMLNLHGRVQLVDAGTGRPEDFAGIDARGKIALLDLSEFCPPEPPIWTGSFCTGDALDRVQNAKDAGAIAALGYGTVGRQFLQPLSEYSVFWIAPTYPIPAMGLTAKEGRVLAARLATGPVTLTVDATEYSPYLYPLTWVSHDRMPAGVRTVSDRDLLRTDHRVHTDNPGSSATLYYQPSVRLGDSTKVNQTYPVTRPAPFTVTTYAGPVRQDVGWLSGVFGDGYQETRVEQIMRPGARTQDWHVQPLVPGAYRSDPRGAPYYQQFCSSCRNGDLLSTQHVLTHDGTTGGAIAYGNTANGPVTTVRLFGADGTEVPRRDGTWLQNFTRFTSPYFMLPQGRATYRMTEDYSSPLAAQKWARTVATERTFTSQRRADGFPRVDGLTNTGTYCSGWFIHEPNEAGRYVPVDPDSPCGASDELYLGYDFGLNLDNTLPAASRQHVTITGYGSPYLAVQPRLSTVKLSLSYDDGRTWQQVRTKANRDGTFGATFVHPALSKTTGAVTVRAEATDTHGNTVTQTITRAYGLTPPVRHGSTGVAAI